MHEMFCLFLCVASCVLGLKAYTKMPDLDILVILNKSKNNYKNISVFLPSCVTDMLKCCFSQLCGWYTGISSTEAQEIEPGAKTIG